MTRVVKFLQNWRNYNGGEVAGFPEEQADTLVKSGTAVDYVDPKAPAAAPKDKMVGEAPKQKGAK